MPSAKRATVQTTAATRRSRGAAAAALIAMAATASSTSAQAYLRGFHPYSPEYLSGSAWDRLEPIDPGNADLGPLGLQTRVLPLPMQHDRDFGLLYRAVGADGSPVFARRDGGITAIFPRSASVTIPSGDVPLIPPDTRFVIGEPAGLLAKSLGLTTEQRPARDPSGGLRIDARLSEREDATEDVARPWLRDEADRSPRRGIRVLLERAARQERSGG
jgi:hypothetical protein